MAEVYETQEPYKQGWLAFWEQALEADNPYASETKDWEMWMGGWEDAAKDCRLDCYRQETPCDIVF